MPTLTIGDRTLDLTDEVLVVDVHDDDAARGLVRGGAVDLGSAGPDTLATLARRRDSATPSETLMMAFAAAQLPELVVAVVRGVRVVRATDVEAASKAVLVLTAIFGSRASGRVGRERARP